MRTNGAASIRYALIWLIVATAVAVTLSLLFRIPYIYSIIAIAVLAFFGHFITLDDDAPGGWSNPDESKQVWSGSLLQLIVKLAAVAILIGLLFAYPEIRQFGA